MNANDNSTLSTADDLSDACADLLAFDRNSLFLERLFSEASGHWMSVNSLCQGLGDVERRIAEVVSKYDASPQVTWIDYPPRMNNPGCCLIVFFAESPDWRSVAVYNKELFSKRRMNR